MKWIWFALLILLFSLQSCKEKVSIRCVHYIGDTNELTVTYFDTITWENGIKVIKSGSMLGQYKGYEVCTLKVPLYEIIYGTNIPQ